MESRFKGVGRPAWKLIEQIEQRAVDSEDDSLVLDDEVVGVSSGPDLFQRRLRGVSWTDCVARSARLSAAVFEECRFTRVVFQDCELSGAGFVECAFRDCFVLGGKAGTILSLSDCTIVGLSVTGLSADRVEIQGGTLKALMVTESKLGQLVFTQVGAPRRSSGRVVMTDVNLGSVGGITQLAKAGVQVSVDPELWSLFGDLLLRQIGIERVDYPEAVEISDSFRPR